MSKCLIAYFSATKTTEAVALILSKELKSDLYEIKPKVKYSNIDLDWMNPNSRSNFEMKDKLYRPQIIKDDFDFDEYDTIYLGFPIWWYVAPTIMNTFLETYDFSNKTIILFATSGGSGFGNTVKGLQDSAPNAVFVEGKVWNRVSKKEIKEWSLKQ